jgi:hypothetical protein
MPRVKRAAVQLYFCLLIPLHAAFAFVAQGAMALSERHLVGLPNLGLESAEGTDAVRIGAVLLPIGIATGILALIGIYRSLLVLRDAPGFDRIIGRPF